MKVEGCGGFVILCSEGPKMSVADEERADENLV